MAQDHPTVSQQREMEHFKSEPLAAQTLVDPSFSPIAISRETVPGNGHTLMGKTWNSNETIRHHLSMFRPENSDANQPAELRRFYTFGNDLNAHPGLLHGGVIACILDSSLSNAVGLITGKEGVMIFTVQLNISYKAPVRTPATVMVKATVKRSDGDGRKIWAEGVVEGLGGTVHGYAEGMWLKQKQKL